jgi:hypothetical protein
MVRSFCQKNAARGRSSENHAMSENLHFKVADPPCVFFLKEICISRIYYSYNKTVILLVLKCRPLLVFRDTKPPAHFVVRITGAAGIGKFRIKCTPWCVFLA